MTSDELEKGLDRIKENVDHLGEWDVTDQMKYIVTVTEFVEKVNKIIDKYDTTKPFKFEIRRLDEYDSE